MKNKSDKKIEMPSGMLIYERVLSWKNGILFGTIIIILLIVDAVFSFKIFSRGVSDSSLRYILYALYGGTGGVVLAVVLCRGLKIIKPNEAVIYTLFGRYHATIMEPGFYFINPLAIEEGTTRKLGAFSIQGVIDNCFSGFGSNVHRIPLSPMVYSIPIDNVLNTQKGYVLSMSAKIEYRVNNPTKALFAVNNFGQYFYENCESILRELIRKKVSYGETDTSRIDTEIAQVINEISDTGKLAIQEKVSFIGIEVMSISIKEAYNKREKKYFSIDY